MSDSPDFAEKFLDEKLRQTKSNEEFLQQLDEESQNEKGDQRSV